MFVLLNCSYSVKHVQKLVCANGWSKPHNNSCYSQGDIEGAVGSYNQALESPSQVKEIEMLVRHEIGRNHLQK